MKLYFPRSNSELTHFQRLLRRLEQNVLRMGALVESSFRLSHQALFERKLETAHEIVLLDEKIDRYYRKIELECTTLLALQTPAAQDLRVISAFLQLVRDLERIGDYAEDLAEIAVKLFPYQPHVCLPEIEVMSNQAQAMLAASLSALGDLDANAGCNINLLDDQVDSAYDRVYQTLAQERDFEGVVEPILLLGLAIRHLERMADHATNIGKRVTYIVTGYSN
ncbi:MAG: phosphate signaling complex protein PhoU [Symploca sp. SIO3C6]|uniref:Phosphate-specific transport system accessory protein PhoU n=1 Tax=Symploca sp. SIO1C4 TaxID=2607765 RepID=A0A6B3NH32_9CYAN|nr:phosphate signaling complex protein PhoU [Symploca sp. SIO3C6]NER30980.1 phosphate signaling complex protein PhoU [Symploca sp. SIO1C4]